MRKRPAGDRATRVIEERRRSTTDNRPQTTDSGEQQVIALDIGGSSIKSAVITSAGRLLGQPTTTPVDSRADADSILGTFASAVRQHLPAIVGVSLLGVSIGCPGPFDYQAGISRIKGVAKYESIYGVNIRDKLRKRLGLPALPIVFRNDAEAAIVGEARHGAGQPYRRLIGVTLGTGCGSAFLVDGSALTRGRGVPQNGWLYCVPFRGVPADDVFSTRGLLGRLQKIDARQDTIEAFAQAARQGNARVRSGFAEFGADLGDFLTPFALEFNAEAVLVLGGIAGGIDIFGPALMNHLPVAVVTGQLGIAAPLFGAAELLFKPNT